ncbi:hypothetical protein [Glaciibacter psychrotolerans]|uniref:Multisubunit Na+/H+ antiporter MnhC subunit n=1 Tax=Glaciibacter psychrotolerans TaxID=670054 RepID=A0A7Z0J876_9MICO|nr:hypothetical protein [Leifsonia psychrotolerans]NYJ21619.1 multisubunit Na+/H+ antiporter MnhC subunit [Leifsonia psychrotolerans]
MSLWIEPTRNCALRWGRYLPRTVLGLAAIVLGVAITTLTSTFNLWFLLIGPILQAMGWLVLPGALWRRLLVVVPCMISGLVPVAGTDFMGAFAVLLTAWLFVRQRPPTAYLTVLFPIAASVWIKAAMHGNAATAPAVLICTAVVVASAWLARRISRHRGLRASDAVSAEERHSADPQQT